MAHSGAGRYGGGGNDNRCQQRGGDRPCCYIRLNYPILVEQGVNDIFECALCHAYHICTGGNECPTVGTSDGIVCGLTGICLGENLQSPAPPLYHQRPLADGSSELENFGLNNIIAVIKSDLARYFITSEELGEVSSAITEGGSLTRRVGYLIEVTFPLCKHIIEEINCGYDIVCSMYIHIIISIYSNRTVYDTLLFKCTRSKKLDAVLKRMRERWMSIATTLEP